MHLRDPRTLLCVPLSISLSAFESCPIDLTCQADRVSALRMARQELKVATQKGKQALRMVIVVNIR